MREQLAIDVVDEVRAGFGAVVVEGYLDVITAHQAGFANVVAPMGTALTPDQVQIVRKLLGNTGVIYLALDADEAGRRAAEKGIDSIMRATDPQLVQHSQFTQGWEVDFDLPVKIIELPGGKDPDDVIKADPNSWRKLVATALPVVDFFIELHTRGRDLRNPEHQQSALSALAPIVASIKDFAKRAVYESRLADRLQMPYELIRATILQSARQTRQRTPPAYAPRPAPPVPASQTDPHAHEDYLLSLLLRFPHVLERVESTLVGELEAFPDLREDVPADLRGAFTRTENRLIWYAWSEHGPNGPGDAANWVTTLDPALRAHVERLMEWKDVPPLSQAGPRVDARDRANEIARLLRRMIADRRAKEINVMRQSVEDLEDQGQLEKKLTLILQYRNVVSAPRKSTVFQDLGTRREEFG